MEVLIINMVAALAIPVVAYIIGRYLLRSRRMAQKAKDVQSLLSEDTRQPVLYLRSFGLDWSYEGPHIQRAFPGAGIEKRLVDALRGVGPVVAVGMPNESLPPLGAIRMYLSDETWRDKVSELMQQAALVVIRPAATEGVMWELNAISELVRPERLLIIFFFQIQTTLDSRMQLYKDFRNMALKHCPIQVPEQLGNAIAIRFDRDWSPHLIYPELTIFQRIVFLSWRNDIYSAVIAPALRKMGVDFKTPYLYRIRQYGLFILAWMTLLFTGVLIGIRIF